MQSKCFAADGHETVLMRQDYSQ